jgi:hypothetical protein
MAEAYLLEELKPYDLDSNRWEMVSKKKAATV